MSKRFFGVILFICGLSLVFQGLFHLAKRQGLYRARVSFSPQVLSREEPQFIEIPNIKINLPISLTEITDKRWPTTETGVSYIKDSGKLGLSGNLVMYGHNWKNILDSLKNSKVGDTLSISSNQNKKYKFEIKYIAIVNPDDVSILSDTKEQRLTLYTCTGIFDSKRLVIVAEAI